MRKGYLNILDERVSNLEKKAGRIEKVLIYLAAVITVKGGADIIPIVSAMFA